METCDEDNEKDDKTKNTLPTQKKQNYRVFHNVSYRVWKLKLKEEKQVLMKGCSENKELRILVRCKNDGSDVSTYFKIILMQFFVDENK